LVDALKKEKVIRDNLASTSQAVEVKAQTPLSPQFLDTAMETVEKDQAKSPLDTYWDRLKNWSKEDDIASTTPIFKDPNTPPNVNAKVFEKMYGETKDTGYIETTAQPEIKIDEAKGAIVPDIETDTKNVDVLSDSIKTTNNVPVSPSISNLGLQTHIEDRLKPASSLSNLFKIATDIFTDNPIDNDLGIDTSAESSNKEENNIPSTSQTIRPKMSADLLGAINSKRLEYGTPNTETVELTRGEDNQSDTNDSKIDNSNSPDLFNWKEEVKIDIHRGNIYNRFIDIDYGENHKNISKISIITNDGLTNYFNPHTVNTQNQTIKWDNKGVNNPNYKVLDVFKIYLIDKNHKLTEVYSNPNVKILDCYQENSGKSF
jgi:hypothetical protein